MLAVRKGDTVFHLCGGSGKAVFAGLSTASSDGYITDQSPDNRKNDYRVDLENFVKFNDPVALKDLFKIKKKPLKAYFFKNRSKSRFSREKLFFAWQNKKLQCQNGAYLSAVSKKLLTIIFNIKVVRSSSNVEVIPSLSKTGTTLRLAALRIGQSDFSENVKVNFSYKCCFPNCDVKDSRFLIGSHIARWSDVPSLRGQTANGLCLCSFHDRAFELGGFTLDKNRRVKVSNRSENKWLREKILSAEGLSIRKSKSITPSLQALRHHWKRHGFRIN